MIKLTYDLVKSTAIEVINEFGPKHIYERQTGEQYYEDGSCLYVHIDSEGVKKPGCIVGHVLNRLGVSLDTLGGFEYRSAGQLLGVLELQDAIAVPDHPVRGYLGIMQSYQDEGECWGHAHNLATSEVGDLSDPDF